ncbi:MAG: hypothetical protein HY706_12505 [Candidatus Hydrogenedentes bacterium]|nr:hypothetical protein [Candidatus Hydrogenedentota bacterium]
MLKLVSSRRTCSLVLCALLAANLALEADTWADPPRVGEPYELLGKRLVFTNWIYVRPGDVGWTDPQGQSVFADESVKMGPFDAVWAPSDHLPWGIQLMAQPPAEIRKWEIKPEFPWEGGDIDVTAILWEDGKLKAWGNCAAGSCYFESRDGFVWERPKLGLVEYQGSKENNLIPSRPPGHVFIDPTSTEERYKCVWVAEDSMTLEELEAFKKRHPDRWGSRVQRTVNGKPYIVCLWGWVSPDGFHWSKLPEPVLMDHTDSYNIGYYDPRLKKYVVYVRTWDALERAPSLPVEEGRWDYWLPNARRSIGRSETDDFRSFPLSEMILQPTPEMEPADDLYYNCFTWIPGAEHNLLMFPTVRHLRDDTTSVWLASSSNGKLWHWVPGGKTLVETGPYGAWNGGCIWPHPPLFELGDGSFALQIRGDNFPHKYPRGLRKIEIGLAIWPHGRIMALRAPERGEFGTVAIVAPSSKLYLNARTKRAGSVRVAAQYGQRGADIIPGREFENSIPIVGDQPHAPVTWKDAQDLGVKPGEPVILLFKMELAEIFALEFE